MTKSIFKTTIITLILIALPLSVSAWSFKDLFPEKSNAQGNDKAELSNLEKKDVVEKYKNWENACEDNDINNLVKNKENLRFSEEEANIIAKNMLNDCGDPMLSSPEIEFRPGFISLEGYLLKPLTGEISVEVIVYPEADKLNFDILKSTYRGFYFPPFLANRILRKPLDELFKTLYSHDDYYTIEPVVKEDELIIKYH
ncbi:hypothetical protein K9M50_03640 [Patescibacteria group bacterium]|nr:hypothetical protein [Patescibacteria group bacterium]